MRPAFSGSADYPEGNAGWIRMDQRITIAVAAVAVIAMAAVAGMMLMSEGGVNETDISYELSFETNGG